ncbi:hypothetical protein IFM89_009016 [Coptis chinensis]|uniref:RNase H type-1 domain-containing protein n=1 Tax=Coptis chinensis TaxID=261450 RepID=A0A835HZ26_9MAGN|nr:hypothetical protein IFM89_009016 [Coptis chinensis]
MYMEEDKKGNAKLNTDGSLSENGCRIGGIVRDSNGKVLLAYTRAGGCRSVLSQELKAILAGLQGCKAIQQLKVEVASDSLRAVKIIRHQEIVPWHCANITAAIDQLIRQFVSVNVIHVHREANRVADHLALLAIDHELEYFVPLTATLMPIVEEDRKEPFTLFF